jgi:hypothetical protein
VVVGSRESIDPMAALPVLSASEVGEFGGYCPQAWWLRRLGVAGAAVGPVRRREGVVLHRNLGRQTDQLRAAEATGRAARMVALVLVVVAAVVLVLALVTRAPSVWATSVEDATLQSRVSSSTAGPLAADDLPVAEVVVALLAASLCVGALAAWLRYRGQRLRASLGLGGTLERARVLAADDSRLGAPALRCERLGLVARADHLVRLADGTVIPVEQKPPGAAAVSIARAGARGPVARGGSKLRPAAAVRLRGPGR